MYGQAFFMFVIWLIAIAFMLWNHLASELGFFFIGSTVTGLFILFASDKS